MPVPPVRVMKMALKHRPHRLTPLMNSVTISSHDAKLFTRFKQAAQSSPPPAELYRCRRGRAWSWYTIPSERNSVNHRWESLSSLWLSAHFQRVHPVVAASFLLASRKCSSRRRTWQRRWTAPWPNSGPWRRRPLLWSSPSLTSRHPYISWLWQTPAHRRSPTKHVHPTTRRRSAWTAPPGYEQRSAVLLYRTEVDSAKTKGSQLLSNSPTVKFRRLPLNFLLSWFNIWPTARTAELT